MHRRVEVFVFFVVSCGLGVKVHFGKIIRISDIRLCTSKRVCRRADVGRTEWGS